MISYGAAEGGLMEEFGLDIVILKAILLMPIYKNKV